MNRVASAAAASVAHHAVDREHRAPLRVADVEEAVVQVEAVALVDGQADA